jgi:hypothetical protein
MEIITREEFWSWKLLQNGHLEYREDYGKPILNTVLNYIMKIGYLSRKILKEETASETQAYMGG